MRCEPRIKQAQASNKKGVVGNNGRNTPNTPMPKANQPMPRYNSLLRGDRGLGATIIVVGTEQGLSQALF